MVVLRATKRLLPSLPTATESAPPSDTALGDWYVNRLVVDRRPLLVLVSSRSLLSLVVPARDVRTLPSRLPGLVAERLRRMGVSEIITKAECAAMDPVFVASTQDRSVIGIMVDFAKMIPSYLPEVVWDEEALEFVESRLAENPCRASKRSEKVIFPDQATHTMLADRWRVG